MGTTYSHMTRPEVTPKEFQTSAFDPLFGFEKTGRKVRVSKVSQEEFASALMPLNTRDYCGKEMIDLHYCKYLNAPFINKCHHEKHVHAQCMFEDYVIRMKEYERERRLMERAKRVGPERAGYIATPAQG